MGRALQVIKLTIFDRPEKKSRDHKGDNDRKGNE